MTDANVGVDQTVLNQSQQLLPQYQEEYLKNLLANVYQVQYDQDGNAMLDSSGQPIVSGLAADSPLYGTPVLDDAGNPIFEKNPDGTNRLDFRGNPIPQVDGGVMRPDIAPFVGNQLEAVRLAEEGVGSYQPYMDSADDTLTSAAGRADTAQTAFDSATNALTGTTGAYDAGSYSDYYDPYTQNVIGQTATDVANASTGLGQAAQTGVSGIDQASANARASSALAQQDLATAGQFGLGSALQGQEMLGGTAGQFTGQGIGSFMNQYEDAAVQQALSDIARSGQMQQNQLGANAVGAGAFGGSRQAVAESELGRNILEQQGRTAAGMRQAGYDNAMAQAASAYEASQGRGQTAAQLMGQLGQAGAGSATTAANAAGNLGLNAEQLAQTGSLQGGQLGMSGYQGQADMSMGLAGLRGTGFGAANELGMNAFQNQQARGQNAGQIFGSLGQGIGGLGTAEAGIGTRQAAMGEAVQGAGQRDVNSLFNIGSLEQGQQQSEYDVQRAGQIEEAYEPFQRMSYMSDIFRGVPSSQGTLTTASQPAPNPVSSILGNAMGISNYQNAGGQGILSGLG
tara:strand:+ start:808 stop:2514 length:1707 start_codon:yes stop_codon:yes gene_type:complete